MWEIEGKIHFPRQKRESFFSSVHSQIMRKIFFARSVTCLPKCFLARYRSAIRLPKHTLLMSPNRTRTRCSHVGVIGESLAIGPRRLRSIAALRNIATKWPIRLLRMKGLTERKNKMKLLSRNEKPKYITKKRDEKVFLMFFLYPYPMGRKPCIKLPVG